MSDKSSDVSVFKPTKEFIQILGNPALVGAEKLEQYEELFASVASAIRPPDAIVWLFTRDITDWSWEIRRERKIKAEIIEYYQKEIVAELIKSELAPSGQLEAAYYRIFQAGADLARWASDPKTRKEIDEELASKGYDSSYILAQAYLRGAAQIDAIDRRIAVHEQRRNAALKEAGLWSDRLQRRLEQAIPEVLEGEFSEAATEN